MNAGDNRVSRLRLIQASILAVGSLLILVVAGVTRDTRLADTDFGQYYIVSQRLRSGAQIYAPITYDRLEAQVEPPEVSGGAADADHANLTEWQIHPLWLSSCSHCQLSPTQ